MSRTLNLIDILLANGRHLSQAGRSTEAIATLQKLAAFHKVPRAVREETHTLLADIYFGQQKYKDARRHLTAAIAANFNNAETHYRMAVAIEEDSDAELDRAEMYYARAVELVSDEPTYWADYASYLFTVGKNADGLKAIRKAYACGANDAAIVGQVAEVLRRENRCDEAAMKLRLALFENRGAQAFRQLWQEHQFQMIYINQEKRRQADAPRPKKPVLLPFTPRAESVGKYANLGGKTIRIDQAEPLPQPQQKPARREVPQPYRRPPKG